MALYLHSPQQYLFCFFFVFFYSPLTLCSPTYLHNLVKQVIVCYSHSLKFHGCVTNDLTRLSSFFFLVFTTHFFDTQQEFFLFPVINTSSLFICAAIVFPQPSVGPHFCQLIFRLQEDWYYIAAQIYFYVFLSLFFFSLIL